MVSSAVPCTHQMMVRRSLTPQLLNKGSDIVVLATDEKSITDKHIKESPLAEEHANMYNTTLGITYILQCIYVHIPSLRLVSATKSSSDLPTVMVVYSKNDPASFTFKL